ncbi:MAG: HAMP domain-containing histidine kinase [Deltaproteobacteria bacterium]|nr:HAMP domain-containing histidine kinase [Deltaproteobacteria bacterium]
MANKSADENFREPGLASGDSGRTDERADVESGETMAAVRVGLAHFVHEITNPLHMIYSTVGLIERELPKANGAADPFMHRAIPRLKSEVETMISLVAALRSQLECIWTANAATDSVDLSLLIDDALKSEAARFQNGAVVVQKNVFEVPAIKASEKLLKQAIVNLLRNAADAMPQGGLLRISAGRNKDLVHLEIADTGGGMPAHLDVFQPFATTKERGIGLGLSITRHVIEENGGTINYRSEPGKGTTFRLTFPLAPCA